MSWRVFLLVLAAGYFIFSVYWLINHGFDNPRYAVWIGLGGMIVMVTVMTFWGRKKK